MPIGNMALAKSRSARAAQAAEARPSRRDKAHEERLVLESALAREPVGNPRSGTTRSHGKRWEVDELGMRAQMLEVSARQPPSKLG